jgi:hypothetical protein
VTDDEILAPDSVQDWIDEEEDYSPWQKRLLRNLEIWMGVPAYVRDGQRLVTVTCNGVWLLATEFTGIEPELKMQMQMAVAGSAGLGGHGLGSQFRDMVVVCELMAQMLGLDPDVPGVIEYPERTKRLIELEAIENPVLTEVEMARDGILP